MQEVSDEAKELAKRQLLKHAAESHTWAAYEYIVRHLEANAVIRDDVKARRLLKMSIKAMFALHSRLNEFEEAL